MKKEEFRNNSLNFIRLLTALKILISHSLTFLKVEIPDFLFALLRCFPGVPIFFSISGFLLWNSLERNDSFQNYAKRRIMRLYPELWFSVLLNCVVMLILYSEYINWQQFGLFQITQSTIFQFWTPVSLKYYGAGEPNGSLWTIGVMVQCYLFLYCSYKLLNNKSDLKWIIVIIIGIIFNIYIAVLEYKLPHILYSLIYYSFIPYYWLFLSGAFIYKKSDILLKHLKRNWPVLLLISAMMKLCFAEYDLGIYGVLENIPMILGIIGFVYAVPNIKIKKDISYGIYVYHMIIVNILISIGYMNTISSIVIVFMISLIIAYVSNDVVDKILKK